MFNFFQQDMQTKDHVIWKCNGSNIHSLLHCREMGGHFGNL